MIRISMLVCATLMSAQPLMAATLLEVNPGTVAEDRKPKEYPAFRVQSGAVGVEAVNENGRLLARYLPGGRTTYHVDGAENSGRENLTITALLRAAGSGGENYPLYSGAGSLAKPGIRLGIRERKGKLTAYALFVAPASRESDKQFTRVEMDPGISIEPNEWTVLTLSANRAGDLELFVNGQRAGGASIRKYEKDAIFPRPPVFATYTPVPPAGSEDPFRVDIAKLVLRNELRGQTKIAAEADELLDAAGK